MSKRVTVELMGAARIVAGQREVSLTLPDAATWREAIAALARTVPELVGEVIAKHKRDLIGAYSLNLGGMEFVGDLDQPVEVPGDGRVTLMDFSDI